MIKFSGNYEEFGYFAGQRMAADNHDFFTKTNPYILQRQFRIYKKYYPEFIDYCKGIARAVNLPEKQVIYDEICSGLEIYKKHLALTHKGQKGCTVFSVKDDHRIYIGRNYDWVPQARNFFKQYDISLSGRNRYIAFSDENIYPGHFSNRTWKYAAEDIINEHGLYAGLTFSHVDKCAYGLNPLHILRYIAEHCKTVEDALSVFRKIPIMSAKNFLIADKAGKSVIVQHYVKGHEVIYPDDRGVLVLTNHIIAPKIKYLDRVRINNPAHSTFVRYAEAEYLIEKRFAETNKNSAFQFADIENILRNSRYIYNDKTIWSLALELSEERYKMYCDTANGPVCKKISF